MAAIAGYLIGSIPSASFLGRLRGVDLHTEGSGNPGTANALRISGPGLASLVLIVEAGKGYGAVWLGALLDDEFGAIAAGLGAVGGNVYTPGTDSGAERAWASPSVSSPQSGRQSSSPSWW